MVKAVTSACATVANTAVTTDRTSFFIVLPSMLRFASGAPRPAALRSQLARMHDAPAMLAHRMELDLRPDLLGGAQLRQVRIEHGGRIHHVVRHAIGIGVDE